MNSPIKIILIFFNIIIILICGCGSDKKPSITEPVENPKVDSTIIIINQFNDNIFELKNLPLALSDEELQPISYLGNYQIVAMGEATHGTKEFFQMKHRLFKYFVENHGFKVIAFESDFAESIHFDRYVTTGEGDIIELLKYKMSTGPWITEEVLELLKWMKQYNEGKSEFEKIHFIGIDALRYNYSVERITEYIQKTIPNLMDKFQPVIDQIEEIKNYSSDLSYRDFYTNIDINKKNEINNFFDNKFAELEIYKDELITKSSLFEYKIFERLFTHLKQTNEYRYRSANNQNYVIENYRDKNMAENAIWTTTVYSGLTKTAVWAANGHIAKTSNYYETNVPSMGYYIKNLIGVNYRVIGFSCNYGTVYALSVNENGSVNPWTIRNLPQTPLKDSYNELFTKLKYKNFFLNLEQISSDSLLGKLLLTPKRFLGIGSGFSFNMIENYPETILKEHYDSIIHFDNSNAAIHLTY